MAGSSTMPWKRSTSSRPLPLVVKLKIRLPEMAASVMMRNTRTITCRGRFADRLGLFAGAVSSRGTSAANKSPHRSAMAAGTAKAARQPTTFTRKPVESAATAMPRLPARPLTPMVKPGRRAPCTIIGMPTGW